MFEKLSQLTAEKVAVSKWRTAANLAKMVTRAGKTPAQLTRLQGLEAAKQLLGRGSKLGLRSQMQGHWKGLGDKFKWTPTRSSRGGMVAGDYVSKSLKNDVAPKVLWRGMTQAGEVGRGHGGYSKNWSHASPSMPNAGYYGVGAKIPDAINYPARSIQPIGFLSAYKAHPKQRYIHDFGLENASLSNRRFGVGANLKPWGKIHESVSDHLLAMYAPGAKKTLSRQEIFTNPAKYNLPGSIYETAVRPKRNPLLRTFGIRQRPGLGHSQSAFETTPNTPYLQKAVTNLSEQQIKPLVKGTDPLKFKELTEESTLGLVGVPGL